MRTPLWSLAFPLLVLASATLWAKTDEQPAATTSAQESSLEDFEAHVRRIAEKYGGGGHKAAAGFSFGASEKFPWKQIR